jgi:hypothetical protein
MGAFLATGGHRFLSCYISPVDAVFFHLFGCLAIVAGKLGVWYFGNNLGLCRDARTLL